MILHKENKKKKTKKQKNKKQNKTKKKKNKKKNKEMLKSPLNQRVQRSYINFQRFKISKIFKKEYADCNN